MGWMDEMDLNPEPILARSRPVADILCQFSVQHRKNLSCRHHKKHWGLICGSSEAGRSSGEQTETRRFPVISCLSPQYVCHGFQNQSFSDSSSSCGCRWASKFLFFFLTQLMPLERFDASATFWPETLWTIPHLTFLSTLRCSLHLS